jgi:hypothetical protein
MRDADYGVSFLPRRPKKVRPRSSAFMLADRRSWHIRRAEGKTRLSTGASPCIENRPSDPARQVLHNLQPSVTVMRGPFSQIGTIVAETQTPLARQNELGRAMSLYLETIAPEDRPDSDVWATMQEAAAGDLTPSGAHACTLLLGSALNTGNTVISGPREFDFPRDHGPHWEIPTEWWYFACNLDIDQRDGGGHIGITHSLLRNSVCSPAVQQRLGWTSQQAQVVDSLAGFTIVTPSLSTHFQRSMNEQSFLSGHCKLQRKSVSADLWPRPL